MIYDIPTSMAALYQYLVAIVVVVVVVLLCGHTGAQVAGHV